jgi:hypothetical protein
VSYRFLSLKIKVVIWLMVKANAVEQWGLKHYRWLVTEQEAQKLIRDNKGIRGRF